MIAWLAYAYVRLLLVLEILLFVASLLLHMSVLIGAKVPFAEYGLILFRGTVIVAVPVAAFIKDSLRWTEQIKTCPRWIWMTALGLGLYGILTFCALAISAPKGASLTDMALVLSGFPLGFDAISFCILYSVLWRGYLEGPEVVRRALHSVLFVAFGVTMFMAYRAGYLHHHNNY